MQGQINAGVIFNSMEILEHCKKVYEAHYANELADRLWHKNFCKIADDFKKLGYPIHGMFCWRSIVLFRPDMGVAIKIGNSGVTIVSQAGALQSKYGTYLSAYSYSLNVDDYTKILPHAHRPFKLMGMKSENGLRKMINALVKGDYVLADAIEMSANL